MSSHLTSKLNMMDYFKLSERHLLPSPFKNVSKETNLVLVQFKKNGKK